MNTEFLMPQEPARFLPEDMNRMLLFCTAKEASDITIQTDSQVLCEVHGRLFPVTQRKMSGGEVGEMLNSIYGPNGTTQILLGRMWTPTTRSAPIEPNAFVSG